MFDKQEIDEFAKYLKEARVGLQQEMSQNSDCPPEVADFVAAAERLEKELGKPESHQLFSDLLLVMSFMRVMSEDQDWEDDEDGEWEDEEEGEWEDEEEEVEEEEEGDTKR